MDAVAERDRRVYPPDWDFYGQTAITSPTDPLVSVPHKQTGEPVSINLFTDTIDRIMTKCGFPEHGRAETLGFYRSYLLSLIPYWDPAEIPDHIPLLQE